MRVAVVVAHPDDEVLGVGGTIRRHVLDGDEVVVHIECTEGLRNRVARMADAVEVSGRLGALLSFGDSPQLGYRVPQLSLSADVWYTHHPDLNRDHRLVNEAVMVAARGQTVYTFETLSSTEWSAEPFAPNLYVGIDLPFKLETLAIYASELRAFPHPRSLEAVAALARFRGSTAQLKAAEAFHVHREVR